MIIGHFFRKLENLKSQILFLLIFLIKIYSYTILLKFTRTAMIHHLEAVKECGRNLLSKVGGISGNKMYPAMIIYPCVIPI